MKRNTQGLRRTAIRIVPCLLSLQLMVVGAQAQPAELDSGGQGGKEDEASEQAELVKKTLNPVADLISVPIQNNWDFGIGPDDAMTKLLKVGKQPLSLQLGYRYYADGPVGGPDWGLRFSVTFLFPKH